MNACLLRIGDGRDEYHERSWQSAVASLPKMQHVVTIDDHAHELGFSGAIAEGWRQALVTGADYIFHLEMDFTFNAPVPLAAMIELLEAKPYLAQVALKRQPVNAEERAAGGIVELHPDDFRQRVENGVIWTENRRCFTTNPCAYSTRLCLHGWPQEPHSEGVFTHRLLADPDVQFAFWGAKLDAPLVHHIGDDRTGTGY